MWFHSLYLLFIAVVCSGYNILVVFPIFGISHSIIGDGCVRLLLEAGHEVTYITPISKIKPHPNLTHIETTQKNDDVKLIIDVNILLNKAMKLNDVEMMYDRYLIGALQVLENENVNNFLTSASETKKKFDVLIVEWLFGELLAGLSAIFDCPYIWVSSLDPHWLILKLVDEATNPAYIPNYNAFYAPPFNFLQRVQQLWIQIEAYYYRHQGIKRQREEYERLIAPIIQKRGRSAPSFDEVIYNASLVLGVSDPTVGYAISLPPMYKTVGGYYIEKVEPLPDHLKKIMDEAKHGVIYFSLGTVVDTSRLPDNIKHDLLQMFSGLNQTVIWKLDKFTEEKFDNVYIDSWLPQQSILAHPNCILFIGHGGSYSTTESIHFGVPMIGIPTLADQFLNVGRAVRRGFGIKVDLSYSMADDLKIAINNILKNSSYGKKAKELSSAFRHRLVPPGKELVHWVEHVVQTRGAPHLRSPALHVPFYQKMYFDLAAVILAIVYVLKKAIQFCCSRKPVAEKKKKIYPTRKYLKQS